MKFVDRENETLTVTGATNFESLHVEKSDDCMWTVVVAEKDWKPVYWCEADGVSYPRSTAPSKHGEWDMTPGKKDEEDATFSIYWEGYQPPVIVAGFHGSPLAEMVRCNNCTLVVEGKYAGVGAWVRESENCTILCNVSHVGVGVMAENGNKNISIGNGEYYYTSIAGVWVRGSTAHVSDNIIRYSGIQESVAGVYVAGGSEKVFIERNTISHVEYGHYWPYDGCGIFNEAGTSGTIATQNQISNCVYAARSNSGLPGPRFVGNRIYDCDYAFEQTDSWNDGGADAIDKMFFNNVLHNTSSSSRNGDLSAFNVLS